MPGSDEQQQRPQDVWGAVQDEQEPAAAAKAPRSVSAPPPPPPKPARDYELDIRYPPPPPDGFLARLWYKTKKDPLVPLGFLATAGILTAGVLSMGGKDKKRQQKLMRLRVGAQAFTIAAFCYGLWHVQSEEKRTGVSRYQKQINDSKAKYTHEED